MKISYNTILIQYGKIAFYFPFNNYKVQPDSAIKLSRIDCPVADTKGDI